MENFSELFAVVRGWVQEHGKEYVEDAIRRMHYGQARPGWVQPTDAAFLRKYRNSVSTTAGMLVDEAIKESKPTPEQVMKAAAEALKEAVAGLPPARLEDGHVVCPICGIRLGSSGEWQVLEDGYVRIEPLVRKDEHTVVGLASGTEAFGESGDESWVQCSNGHALRWLPEGVDLIWD